MERRNPGRMISDGGWTGGKPASSGKRDALEGGSFEVGWAFGVDVRVHRTFFLLPAFFAGYGYVRGGNLRSARP